MYIIKFFRPDIKKMIIIECDEEDLIETLEVLAFKKYEIISIKKKRRHKL